MFTIDENTDICGTFQLLIFIPEIDLNFNVSEELAELCSLNWTTTWEDSFIEIDQTFKKLDLSWKNLLVLLQVVVEIWVKLIKV